MNEERSQQPPPDDASELADFYVFPLTRGEAVWRCHRSAKGPWYFCANGDCRFDLESPNGTCYVAPRGVTAILEVLRFVGKVIHKAELDLRSIAQLELHDDYTLADTVHTGAWLRGITRELSSIEDYSIPQAWARKFRQAGFGGLRYWARHDSSPEGISYALFGPMKGRPWQVEPSEPLDKKWILELEREAEVAVVGNPRFSDINIEA